MDHPRACGVYAIVRLPPVEVRGSSPRVRGLPVKTIRALIDTRIIPARAGFTIPGGFIHWDK